MAALRTELTESEAHVYWADLDDPCWLRTLTIAHDLLLSADEQMKASRFRFARDRHRYALSHSILRKLIAKYVGEPAAALVFEYSSHGKPRLSHPGPHFNLSHTHGIAVFALAPIEIGVDTEHPDAEFIIEDTAHMYLSGEESAELDIFPEFERKRACLRIWTRKEALLKGIGIGLIDDLRDIHVGASKSCSMIHPSICKPEEEWVIRDIGPYHDAVGALAYRRRDARSMTIREVILSPNALTEERASAMPFDAHLRQESAGV